MLAPVDDVTKDVALEVPAKDSVENTELEDNQVDELIKGSEPEENCCEDIDADSNQTIATELNENDERTATEGDDRSLVMDPGSDEEESARFEEDAGMDELISVAEELVDAGLEFHHSDDELSSDVDLAK
jgi:hypothetical protein